MARGFRPRVSARRWAGQDSNPSRTMDSKPAVECVSEMCFKIVTTKKRSERLLRGMGRVWPLRHSVLPRWWDSNPRVPRGTTDGLQSGSRDKFEKCVKKRIDEVMARDLGALPLSYGAASKSCAGGTRTHDHPGRNGRTPSLQSIRVSRSLSGMSLSTVSVVAIAQAQPDEWCDDRLSGQPLTQCFQDPTRDLAETPPGIEPCGSPVGTRLRLRETRTAH